MRKGVIFAALVFVSPLVLGQGAPPAKEKMCRACHGLAGAKPILDTYPKLNGQNKGYLAGSLKAYRAGQRTGGLAAAMAVQAKGLSDEDIDALAAYYSSQK